MGVKERILAIRLMEKAIGNPAAAEKMGIMAENKSAWKETASEKKEGE